MTPEKEFQVTPPPNSQRLAGGPSEVGVLLVSLPTKRGPTF